MLELEKIALLVLVGVLIFTLEHHERKINELQQQIDNGLVVKLHPVEDKPKYA